MKKTITYCFAILFTANAIAQKDTIRPQFSGGTDAMYQFIITNLQYPEAAINKNLYGTVLIEFEIDTTGDMVNIHVLESVDPILDNEAVRVLKAMPRWEPGMYNGQKIKLQYIMPFKFVFSEPEKQPKHSKKRKKSLR